MAAPGALASGPLGPVCLYPGCEEKPFTRSFDLKRHYRSHYLDETTLFECVAIGCNRKGEKSFDRFDKLRDHVRQGHIESTLYPCPVNCGLDPVPKAELHQHIFQHHNAYELLPQFKILKLLDYDRPISCPIDGNSCEGVDAKYLHGHMLSHRDLFDRALLQNLMPSSDFQDIFFNALDCPLGSCRWSDSFYNGFAAHVKAHTPQEVSLINDCFQLLGQYYPPVIVRTRLNGGAWHCFPLAEVKEQCERIYENGKIPARMRVLIQAMSGLKEWKSISAK